MSIASPGGKHSLPLRTVCVSPRCSRKSPRIPHNYARCANGTSPIPCVSELSSRVMGGALSFGRCGNAGRGPGFDRGGELATVVRQKLLNMLQVSAVIFVLSSLVFRSAVAGLLVLAPLVCAALVNLGVMGWFGSWLSFATATYTSMGVSLGADFAIYLLFRPREEGRGGGPLGKAISVVRAVGCGASSRTARSPNPALRRPYGSPTSPAACPGRTSR